MADLLGKGAAWLRSKRHAQLALTVTYVRGAGSVELLATPGRTRFEQVDAHGSATQLESRDWLVRAEDLVLAGARILPQQGDHIVVTEGGTTYTCEVLAPGHGPAHEYSGGYRGTLRIHTKLVDEE